MLQIKNKLLDAFDSLACIKTAMLFVSVANKT